MLTLEHFNSAASESARLSRKHSISRHFLLAREPARASGPIPLAGGKTPSPVQPGRPEGPGMWRWASRSGGLGRPRGSVEGDRVGGSDEGAAPRVRALGFVGVGGVLAPRWGHHTGRGENRARWPTALPWPWARSRRPAGLWRMVGEPGERAALPGKPPRSSGDLSHQVNAPAQEVSCSKAARWHR